MNAPLKKPLMDEALLAKLTGRLGDKATVEKICSGFGEVYAVFLPDIIKSETNLDVEVAYLGCDSGHKNDLVANLGDNTTLVDATLRNWSPNITLACGNSFIITLMEHLLGAAADAVEQPADRLLSVIELELAVMVFDKFAHFSMNLIKPICADEAPVFTSPHNDLNYLEDMCKKHERVAYVADGFYSMGGATLVKELVALQDRYGLFLYFDDSHGLSIYGERGEGFVRAMLGQELNPRTVIIASLGKAFGSTGGVVMLGPKQHEDIVARFAGPMGWSQCVSAPSIGASLASARLHASPELHQLQQKLRANIRLFDELFPSQHRGDDYPIKVIEIGDESLAVQRSKQMLERGFYTSAVFFPIVPRGKAGLRIMLRADLSREDIMRLGTAAREVMGQK